MTVVHAQRLKAIEGAYLNLALTDCDAAMASLQRVVDSGRHRSDSPTRLRIKAAIDRLLSIRNSLLVLRDPPRND